MYIIFLQIFKCQIILNIYLVMIFFTLSERTVLDILIAKKPAWFQTHHVYVESIRINVSENTIFLFSLSELH